MAKRKKIKIKYKNFIPIILIIVVIIMLTKGNNQKEEPIINFQKDYVGKEIKELKKLDGYQIIEEREFSDIYDKDIIISIKENNKEIKAIVSNGKINDDLYREKNVNELGNVPIMMYHGIIDTDENKYTGGNVDKNGYNRTSNAFREDLEFYYNNGYRMIRLNDYVDGIIDVELGYSPIILTFDDGNQNNFNVLGRNSDGNEDILKYLIDNGYDIGNHTTIHSDFTKISTAKTQEVVGKMHQKLEGLLGDKYTKILALPFGSPYKKTHENYPYILKGNYNGFDYVTKAALRVGWEPEVSPFNKNFDKDFLKRCRAYDNNGKEFDIEMVFKNLEKKRYVSDGNKDLIVIKSSDKSKLNEIYENVHMYEEVK